jgi:D-alanyl-lipoteichoic acid acyltransferase DltB (MBOAT superfamily)
MAATCCAHWLTPVAYRHYVLILATAVLLFYADARSLCFLAAMTTAVGIALRAPSAWRSRAALGVGAAILAVLAGFKVLEPAAGAAFWIDRIVPLGLSYYSLRCLHLLLEHELGQLRQPSLSQVVAYLFFPATIVAGPIHRYAPFAAERPQPGIQWPSVSAGLERMLYGYFKIIVCSNYLVTLKLYPWLTASLEPNSAAHHYLDALRYGLSLYLQFSGYSDIAVGFALLLGHKVIENFRWPLLRTNIAEFWRCWHISLTSLCREYVFTSVYAATRKAWAGVLATMLAVSLWHGITLNYLAWGLYHGTGVLIYQQWSRSRAARTLQTALPAALHWFIGWFLTFQFVMLGFIWTKEADIVAAWQVWSSLLRWP